MLIAQFGPLFAPTFGVVNMALAARASISLPIITSTRSPVRAHDNAKSTSRLVSLGPSKFSFEPPVDTYIRVDDRLQKTRQDPPQAIESRRRRR